MNIKPLILLLVTAVCLSTVSAGPQRFRGYPAKNPTNLVEQFRKPPKGYGNVPFYWWNGDVLTRERLSEQLKVLSESAIDGFAVSYCHTDPRIDTAMAANGYGFAGNTEPGSPELLSEPWWEIWKWYASECAKYDMGVGMDDYTFGWPNNGYYPDQLKNLPEFASYQGSLQIDSLPISAGERIEIKTPATLISAVAWPGKIDLADKITDGLLRWQAPKGENSTIYLTSTRSGYAIHPNHGEQLINLYFGEFERRMTKQEFANANYFFQDELTHPIEVGSWSEDFAQQFLSRKGYDIRPYLAALKTNIGPNSPKIRLDYCDILMDLAEERYFIPIYKWHADKGLIYGSDNHGRGKDPLAYVDYFRANSWYTAPGNDAPANGSSFIETKVSSSISHLYGRPRTWLEAFHSMGWGSSGAWLTRQIDHHFIAGGNLVCMHGLYYSTHGGWWEWAPPDFHVRMPYWPHMKSWLEYTERMSYLLSQGSHVCDIALMYPTESMQAYPDADTSEAFGAALELSRHGLDYDFMHYGHLRKATSKDGSLEVADEKYRILVLADLRACHHSTLQRAVEHFRTGGIVLASGNLPQATTLSGEGSPEMQALLAELFGAKPTKGKLHTNKNGGTAAWLTKEELPATITQLITTDFRPSSGQGKVLHRRMGDRDVYMVTDVAQGDTCFFRTKGRVELWNAATGEKSPMAIVRQDANGTYVKMHKQLGESYLVVFSPGKPLIAKQAELLHQVSNTAINGTWEVEFRPTMDNTWGDYRLPATKEMIGPEAPIFAFRKSEGQRDNWYSPNFNSSSWQEAIWGYGIQMLSCNIDSATPFKTAEKQISESNSQSWQPYEFSWKLGVWDNPGSQGFHGLKGRLDDRFLILNAGAHQFFRTNVIVPTSGKYRIVTAGCLPDFMQIDGNSIEPEQPLELAAGLHPIVVGYASTSKHEYGKSPFDFDPRQRSMIAVYPAQIAVQSGTTPYDNDISSAWGRGGHLLFTPYNQPTNTWQFRTKMLPGVREIRVTTYGALTSAWIAGKQLDRKTITSKKGADGVSVHTITLPSTILGIELLALQIEATDGYQGAGVMAQPVKFTCATGHLSAGNWADAGAMRYYSGGLLYRKQITIEPKRGEKIELNLGNVVATCEVLVNGKRAAILLSPPFKTDITKLVTPGANQIEVLVYSTLSNHYQTIPSFYRGTPDGGLLGPVSMSISK